ncbi:hypothetical protein RHMOL_Rhmol10G0294600 [Rhododendron molle]|uniref:Uncharacterized protein n=1 Tax=Rhododendron molle TaxID=49168 RepID=A0ACC0M7W3_RHOML|nr:hypothetical protein RHMOL_Rhmol10G0294600 [Rhododendron molle]
MCIDSESLQWIEVVLELKDAVDWIYKGEGAANLFLAYSGSSSTFVWSFMLHHNGHLCFTLMMILLCLFMSFFIVGKVLCIQKDPRIESPRNGYDSEDSHSALANDECLL